MKSMKVLGIVLFALLLGLPIFAQEEPTEEIDFYGALQIAQEQYGEGYQIIEIEREVDVEGVTYWQVRVYRLEGEDDDNRFESIYIAVTTGEIFQEITQDDDDNGTPPTPEVTPEVTPEITPEVTPQATPSATPDAEDNDDNDNDDDGDDNNDDNDDDDQDDRDDYRYDITTIVLNINVALEEAQRIYPTLIIIGLELEDDEENLTWVIIFTDDREVEISTVTGNVLGFGYDADVTGGGRPSTQGNTNNSGAGDDNDDNDDGGNNNNSGGGNDNDDDNDDGGDNDDDNDDGGDDDD